MENQLSKNFTLSELARSSTADRYKIDNTPGQFEYDNLKKLCEKVLQPIRDKWGKPIVITSGYRSPQLNVKVKGSGTSQHCKGEAADFEAASGENGKLFHIIEAMIHNGEIEVGQLIWEKGDEYNPAWIHISLPYHKKNQILNF